MYQPFGIDNIKCAMRAVKVLNIQVNIQVKYKKKTGDNKISRNILEEYVYK